MLDSKGSKERGSHTLAREEEGLLLHAEPVRIAAGVDTADVPRIDLLGEAHLSLLRPSFRARRTLLTGMETLMGVPVGVERSFSASGPERCSRCLETLVDP